MVRRSWDHPEYFLFFYIWDLGVPSSKYKQKIEYIIAELEKETNIKVSIVITHSMHNEFKDDFTCIGLCRPKLGPNHIGYFHGAAF